MSEAIEQVLAKMEGSTHRAGTLGIPVLRALASVLPKGPITTLETGCGKSTILFSNISTKHYVFAYDDRGLPDSSVSMVQSSPDFVAKTTEFVYGPTQTSLRKFDFPEKLNFDVVLIDGPHGYPFPDLEYALLYDRLKAGSILIVDDIHIPSIGHMYDLLRSDRMYDEIGVFASTGVLRRTEIKGVPSDGDHWFEQNYNVSRFPRSMEIYHPDRSTRFGQKIVFDKARVVEKYNQRGFEYDADGQAAKTIDLGAVLEFSLPQSGGEARFDIVYQSVYNDAAVAASVVSQQISEELTYSKNFLELSLTIPIATDGKVRLTFLHPNATPEHDLGKTRYDFRRYGCRIKSIVVTSTQPGTSKTPVNAVKKKSGLLKKIKQRISRMMVK